jgi:hypothetical protein
MAALTRYLKAPRLELVLAPADERFVPWLMVHLPGEAEPQARPLSGPLARDDAAEFLASAYRAIDASVRAATAGGESKSI